LAPLGPVLLVSGAGVGVASLEPAALPAPGLGGMLLEGRSAVATVLGRQPEAGRAAARSGSTSLVLLC
jgi:hypothetical protein